MLPSNEPRFTKGLLPTARLLAGRLETSAARSPAIPIRGSKREKILAGPDDWSVSIIRGYGETPNRWRQGKLPALWMENRVGPESPLPSGREGSPREPRLAWSGGHVRQRGGQQH